MTPRTDELDNDLSFDISDDLINEINFYENSNESNNEINEISQQTNLANQQSFSNISLPPTITKQSIPPELCVPPPKPLDNTTELLQFLDDTLFQQYHASLYKLCLQHPELDNLLKECVGKITGEQLFDWVEKAIKYFTSPIVTLILSNYPARANLHKHLMTLAIEKREQLLKKSLRFYHQGLINIIASKRPEEFIADTNLLQHALGTDAIKQEQFFYLVFASTSTKNQISRLLEPTIALIKDCSLLNKIQTYVIKKLTQQTLSLAELPNTTKAEKKIYLAKQTQLKITKKILMILCARINELAPPKQQMPDKNMLDKMDKNSYCLPHVISFEENTKAENMDIRQNQQLINPHNNVLNKYPNFFQPTNYYFGCNIFCALAPDQSSEPKESQQFPLTKASISNK